MKRHLKQPWHKKLILLLTACLLLTTLSGCGKKNENPADSNPAASDKLSKTDSISFTDSLGNEVTLENHEKVISLYGSFAEVWTLAGGTLTGVTQDAVDERNMDLGDDVQIIGTVKSPNFEEILALQPDFVILSADISTQVDLDTAFTEAGIVHAYFRVDTFDEYEDMLRLFCDMTDRNDLYKKYGVDVRDQITRIQTLTKESEKPTGLLIRAFSTGAKAKGTDNLAGVIMEDLGVDNIVERHESLLEDLSIEEIIAEDPDYIFVSTMGDEGEALAALGNGIQSNPAWADLSAVKNDHYYILPKELFHYKPNARWGESYAYMARLLYPEKAEDIDAIIKVETK